VCNGDTSIAGIGRDKAGQDLVPHADGVSERQLDLPKRPRQIDQAASDLYGANSVAAAAVARAWSAVW
jgi:Zn-dependent metalloprotease